MIDLLAESGPGGDRTWIWIVLGVAGVLMVGAIVLILVYLAKKKAKLEGTLEPLLDENGEPVLDEDGEPMMHHVIQAKTALLDEDGEPILDEDGEPMYEETQDDDAFLGTMAAAMPWVISLLVHVGIFMVMMFIVFIAIQKDKKPDDIIIPSAEISENPGGAMTDSKMKSVSPTRSTTTAKSPTRSKSPSVNTGKTSKALNVIGAAGGGASGGSPSMGATTAGGGGPKGAFFGTPGGNAYNIVYVIDRSGSMIDIFEDVKMEMIRSIGKLRSSQTFHIILFAKTKPREPQKELMEANTENKINAVKFLDGQFAEGETDPIPAIERAFAVLKKATRKGRLVYLLTDGVFPDNDAVLRDIAKMNGKLTGSKKVLINTFLYGNKPPEAESVMKKIAKESGGRYKFVEQEE